MHQSVRDHEGASLTHWLLDHDIDLAITLRFLKRWRATHNADALPCPYCFVKSEGEAPVHALTNLAVDGGDITLYCANCKIRFELPRAEASHA